MPLGTDPHATEGVMHSFFNQLRDQVTDHRFLANLTVTYGAVVVVVLVSLLVRRLIGHGGERLAQWTGLRWLDRFGKEAAQRARRLIARLTWLAVVLLSAGGITYHALGRDVRGDVEDWYTCITMDQWLAMGLRAGAVAGLAVAAWVGVRVVRRLRARAEAWVVGRIGDSVKPDAIACWFTLLQRFAGVAVCLVGLWAAGHVVGLVRLADHIIDFVLYVISIVVGARLLTLAGRAASRVGAHVGDRYLGGGRLKNYWERVKLLLPFGERCFEAAVCIEAAAMVVKRLRFIAFVAEYGDKIVECIGIFFVTRVLIELSHVLLFEAFGLHKENSPANQQWRTLVPLLQSIAKYVLYFGSGVAMWKALGGDPTTLMAGAGIVGLAVGLGAQSLVTDVVSGFFILFENQYLVGDYVEIGHASGVVEAVGIRVTEVRDARGKVHLIPNGQIKGVINYSKGYINAVVDVKVPSGSDLEATFRRMAEAGRRLKEKHGEVLAMTEIQGLVELGTSEMTVRAVTKVQPGTHQVMENEYRRLLKIVFDEAQPGQAKLAA
jgi:small conductance mechanosensitive channel